MKKLILFLSLVVVLFSACDKAEPHISYIYIPVYSAIDSLPLLNHTFKIWWRTTQYNKIENDEYLATTDDEGNLVFKNEYGQWYVTHKNATGIGGVGDFYFNHAKSLYNSPKLDTTYCDKVYITP